jgi:hypothetical protein
MGPRWRRAVALALALALALAVAFTLTRPPPASLALDPLAVVLVDFEPWSHRVAQAVAHLQAALPVAPVSLPLGLICLALSPGLVGLA